MKLRATDPRLLNSSTKKYRRAWLPFLALLADHGLRPAISLEFDDRIVEFRNDLKITKSHMETWLQLWNTFCLPTKTNSLVTYGLDLLERHVRDGVHSTFAARMAADGHSMLGASPILYQALRCGRARACCILPS